MLIDMITVDMVQMPIVQVVDMTIVLDCGVPAPRLMLVVVVLVLFAGAHDLSPPRVDPSEASCIPARRLTVARPPIDCQVSGPRSGTFAWKGRHCSNIASLHGMSVWWGGAGCCCSWLYNTK